jgi:hypothetical protein
MADPVIREKIVGIKQVQFRTNSEAAVYLVDKSKKPPFPLIPE